ncbi:hypothetical protein KBJ94_26045 [Pseudomonas sp. ITA]|uniref:hypothetical protein n=1 Tax=Pseudomonas sp. ITA TaxID=2825841 RepID=UPI0024974A83|nr:hypothetical protein [Pseudomonas sp. ITA]MDI2145508.1 hypothetical protein [Pseudomonas sp. ITA]
MSQLDAMDALNLPASVYMQIANFLARIETCLRLEELQRVADRADGFVLGIETVRAVNYDTIERLHVLLKDAVQAQREALQA